MFVSGLVKRVLPTFLVRGFEITSARIPCRVKLGPRYYSVRRFLKSAIAWDRQQIEVWQLERINELLADAWDNVPGYQALYRQAGIDTPRLSSLSELGQLPQVTKELIRDNLSDFTSRRIGGWWRIYNTTGGSTGIPFGFYLDAGMIDTELAFCVTMWELAGFRHGARVGVLRGGFIGSESKLTQRFKTAVYDSYELSTYYLTEKSYPIYRDTIGHARLEFLHVYPSAACDLARLVIERGDQSAFSSVRAILSASETLFGWQRELLQRAFPTARVFDFYGHSEKAVLASNCETSETYHVWPTYGVAELLGPNGPVHPGETGDIIATSLWNRSTPFIRYRTADRATLAASQQRCCTRPWMILSRIDGRIQEFIETSSGRRISMTAINMHDALFDQVRQFQFYQELPGFVVLRVLPKPGYNDAESQRIAIGLQQKLGNDVALRIQVVDEIARTRAGKYRFLEQKIARLAPEEMK